MESTWRKSNTNGFHGIIHSNATKNGWRSRKSISIHFIRKVSRSSKISNRNKSCIFTIPILILKKVWDELTPEQQEIIEDAAIEAGEYNRELTRQTAEEALEELKSQMEFTEISDEELAKFKEAVQPVIDKYKSQIGTEIVDQYLAEVEKYSKE